jgi:hypothetical protein
LGSRHRRSFVVGKTNRYKIQLTLHEVRAPSMLEIDALAVAPRSENIAALRPVPDEDRQMAPEDR